MSLDLFLSESLFEDGHLIAREKNLNSTKFSQFAHTVRLRSRYLTIVIESNELLVCARNFSASGNRLF